MAFFSSSSLTASDMYDHELPRHKSGLIKFNGGHSKQELVEKKMFGSRFGKHGQDFGISRKFRGGSSLKRMSKAPSMRMNSHTNISPSVESFEHLMHASVTHNPNKKKSFFKQKKIS